MRFTMSTTEEKKSSDVPSFVIAQPESSSAEAAGKKSKRNIIIAVTGVVVVALVLTAILVGMYIFTEAEKDLVKVTMQLKNNMTQDMSSNPNTNVVQFHVKESNQETWTVNDYNSDLKVMKIQTATGTNCFVTALNESAPVDVPNMKSSDGQDKAGSVAVSFTTTGTPIKDTSFLSKTARDMCTGVSTYWLYPSCSGLTENKAPNTTLSSNGRDKRSLWYAICNSHYYYGSCPYSYTCTLHSGSYCLVRTGTYYCYTFAWVWTWPYSGGYPYYCTMYG